MCETSLFLINSKKELLDMLLTSHNVQPNREINNKIKKSLISIES